MRIPFRLVDVFAERPLAGNQLCVVPEPVPLDPELMQAVAREIGFSETTFVTELGPGAYSMRIFTPGTELPFAGHPTLGTAFVLVSEGTVSSPVTQSVKGGRFPVEVDVPGRFARMRQGLAEFGAQPADPAAAARACGLAPEDLHPDLPARVVSTGLPHLIVPARDGEALGRARPQPEIRQVLDPVGADGLYVFAAAADGVKARMFAPDVGIAEDPATGSAAGPLGAYLAEYGVIQSGNFTISQGDELGRPSLLHVRVEGEAGTWRPFVGGGVHVVGRGRFDLPG